MAAQARVREGAATFVRAVTYNIRRCRGLDGKRNPDRTLRIIGGAGGDVVALQEVSDPIGETAADAPFDFFRRETGMAAIAAPTLGHGVSAYGNLLLSRWPVLESQTIDLSVPGREPRNAIRAMVDAPVGPVRVIATHLGLSLGERRVQTNALATLVAEDLEVPTILMGDLNEWRWRTRGAQKLGEVLRAPDLPLSFPARWPVFPLDQIWIRQDGGGGRIGALRTGESRIASDHLPVVAEIRLHTARASGFVPA